MGSKTSNAPAAATSSQLRVPLTMPPYPACSSRTLIHPFYALRRFRDDLDVELIQEPWLDCDAVRGTNQERRGGSINALVLRSVGNCYRFWTRGEFRIAQVTQLRLSNSSLIDSEDNTSDDGKPRSQVNSNVSNPGFMIFTRQTSRHIRFTPKCRCSCSRDLRIDCIAGQDSSWLADLGMLYRFAVPANCFADVPMGRLSPFFRPRGQNAPRLNPTARPPRRKREIECILDHISRDSKYSLVNLERSRRNELFNEAAQTLLSWLQDVWRVVYEHSTQYETAHRCLVFAAESLVKLCESRGAGCKCPLNIPINVSIEKESGEVVKTFAFTGLSNIDHVILWVWRDLFVSMLVSSPSVARAQIPQMLVDIEDVLTWQGLEWLLYGGNDVCLRFQFRGWLQSDKLLSGVDLSESSDDDLFGNIMGWVSRRIPASKMTTMSSSTKSTPMETDGAPATSTHPTGGRTRQRTPHHP
ncbi:Bifunctional epoxide hydrolase [Salix suchowensis]|nr:Bifunctional epoxide hydrolase [Salix suchowensis]